MANNHLQTFLDDENKSNYRKALALLSNKLHHHGTLDWESNLFPIQKAAALIGPKAELQEEDNFHRYKICLQATPELHISKEPVHILFEQHLYQQAVKLWQAAQSGCAGKENLGPEVLERSFRDSVELAQTRALLKASEERFALAARGANDGLWEWNVKTSEVYFSPRWKMMLGYGEGELQNNLSTFTSILHPEDKPRLKEAWTALQNSRDDRFMTEYRILDRSGSYRWAKASGALLRDNLGRVTKIVGSQTDLTAQRQIEGQLLHHALHDTLTGLPNRALFMDRLGLALRRTRRRSAPLFAVLILDIDRFKVINDSFGHNFGDLLLMELSRRLEKVVRPGDSIARWGGDEFTLLLEELDDESSATEVATRLLKVIQMPFRVGEEEVFPSASIGVAISSSDYQRPEEILRDADTAMERAKAQGKGHKIVFEHSMRAKAREMLQIENDLRLALERNEFVVHYQPIIDLSNGMVTGFEALVRWQHPTRGLVPPNDFIPLAEETGQIIPLGLWVMHEACAQLRRWREHSDSEQILSMCVNLSVRQLTQPDLVEQIRGMVTMNGLPPGSLKLELTETGVMNDVEGAISILQRLQDSGVELCVDDFGTGHSSLGYLQRLPIQILKIDRSFVSRLNRKNKDGALVHTIIELARHLGIKVVAEGVENEEQLSILKELECQYAQGYLFSRPVASEMAEKFLPQINQRLVG